MKTKFELQQSSTQRRSIDTNVTSEVEEVRERAIVNSGSMFSKTRRDTQRALKLRESEANIAIFTRYTERAEELTKAQIDQQYALAQTINQQQFMDAAVSLVKVTDEGVAKVVEATSSFNTELVANQMLNKLGDAVSNGSLTKEAASALAQAPLTAQKISAEAKQRFVETAINKQYTVLEDLMKK